MGIQKTIGYIIAAVIMVTVVCGMLFGDGADNTINSSPTATHISTPAPTSEPTPVESSIADNINVIKSGQDITVECKRLSVFGNNNAIQIDNSDVERIVVTGYGNSIGYSCDADPRIDDLGDYNDVWQRWLT